MSTIAERVQQQLRERHQNAVAAAEENGALLLSGHVASEDERETVERSARELAGGMPVVNMIEVEQQVEEHWDGETVEDNTPVEDLDGAALESLNNAGLDEVESVPLDTNVIDVIGNDDYDAEAAPEADPAYFPPTDPVFGANAEGNIEVLGGFAPTSMTDNTVEPSAEDGIPGDEALADAVRRELREDASTTDLALEVEVVRGVVHLRGSVPDLMDAENAQAVASIVPGVRDVLDETDVEAM